jgi:hypothetical protein
MACDEVRAVDPLARPTCTGAPRPGVVDDLLHLAQPRRIRDHGDSIALAVPPFQGRGLEVDGQVEAVGDAAGEAVCLGRVEDDAVSSRELLVHHLSQRKRIAASQDAGT